MASLIITVRKQNACIDRFTKAGATDSRTAKSLQELGIPNDYAFAGMYKRGIFKRNKKGDYYLVTEASRVFLRARRRALTVTFLVLACVWLASMYVVFMK